MCISSFQTELKIPYAKSFFHSNPLDFDLLGGCTPSELSNSVSSLPCPLGAFYCRFPCVYFLSSEGMSSSEDKDTSMSYVFHPRSHQHYPCNKCSKWVVVRQWGRKWPVYMLDFVDLYTGLDCKGYQISFYLT